MHEHVAADAAGILWPVGPGAEEILELWRSANATYMPKDVFYRRAQGLPVDPEALWKTFTSLRRYASVEMPFPPMLAHGGADVSWIALPRDCQVALIRLAEASSNGSVLYGFLSGKPARVRLYLMADEIAAALQKDGFDATSGMVKRAVMSDKDPTTDDGRVLRSLLGLLGRVSSFSGKRITQGLIERVYEEISDTARSPLNAHAMRRYRVPDPSESARALGYVCELLGDDDHARYGDPVVSWIGATTMFWDESPLPSCNALVELVVRQIFFQRHQRSLLGYVDFLSQSLQWEAGGYTRVASLPRFQDVASDDCGEGYDATYYLSAALVMIGECLDTLRGRIIELRDAEHRAIEGIKADERLNMRQKSLLADLVEDMTRRVDLKQYEERFEVAHSTALSDMQGLVRFGYAEQRYEGRKLTFGLDVPNMLPWLKQKTT